jgi:hypothetical protein
LTHSLSTLLLFLTTLDSAHKREAQLLATHHCLIRHPQLHTFHPPPPLHLVAVITIHFPLPLHLIPILIPVIVHVCARVRFGTTSSLLFSTQPCPTPTTLIPMAEATGALAGLTPQDQKLVLAAFKSLKTGFDVSLLCILPRRHNRIPHAGFSCFSDLSKSRLWLVILRDDETFPNFERFLVLHSRWSIFWLLTVVQQVDYTKLAENMEWYLKDDETKPNTKKANNAWLNTRKKLFPDGLPAGSSTDAGTPAKAKVPATPRKKKDADLPNTPAPKIPAPKTPAPKTPVTKTLASKRTKKSEVKAESDAEEASAEPATNLVPNDTTATGPSKRAASVNEGTGEVDVKETEGNAATEEAQADADGDSPMNDSPADATVTIAGEAPTTPVASKSVADDMSAGSMSPTSVLAKAKPVPTTPKPKDTKTPTIGSKAKAANSSVPATPVTPVTPVTPTAKATPRKRKTKAEKEAEAAAAANSEVGDDNEVEDEPPAKKRKSIDGTAKAATTADDDDEDAVDDDADGEQSSAKPTPSKKPRKPSAAALAKKAEKEKQKADKEKEKAEKLAAKEKETAEKLAKKKQVQAEKDRVQAEKERVKAEKADAKKTPTKKAAAATTAGEADYIKTKKGRAAPPSQVKKEPGKPESDGEDEEAEADLATNAQEQINKQADAVFNGARIDKPASNNEIADEEVAITVKGDEDKPSSFIAINDHVNDNVNGTSGDRAGSAARAASETAEAALKLAGERDEDTITVADEDVDDHDDADEDEDEDGDEDEEKDDDTIAVAEVA